MQKALQERLSRENGKLQTELATRVANVQQRDATILRLQDQLSLLQEELRRTQSKEEQTRVAHQLQEGRLQHDVSKLEGELQTLKLRHKKELELRDREQASRIAALETNLQTVRTAAKHLELQLEESQAEKSAALQQRDR